MDGGDPGMALLRRWIDSRDDQAFSTIVSTHERLVRHACRTILGRGEDSEDAAQETFIRLARDAAQVRSNLTAWLYACARSVAINMLVSRSARRRREHAVAAEAPRAFGPQDHASDADAESLALVERHLSGLSPADRDAILSYYCMGQTQEQIGCRLGISQVAAKKRIDKATDRLRRRLGARAASAVALLLLLAGSVQACDGPCLWPALASRGLPTPRSAWLRPVLVAAALLLGLALAGAAWMAVKPAAGAPAAGSAIMVGPHPDRVPAPTAGDPGSGGDPAAGIPPRVEAVSDGVAVAMAPSPLQPVVDVEPWGQAWLPHEVRIEAEAGGLDARILAPGVAKIGWAHRPHPQPHPADTAISARIRLVKAHCPFAFAWLGFCHADGSAIRSVAGDQASGDPERTRLTDVGVWHEVRLEIGHQEAQAIPVSWSIDGQQCFRASLQPESIRHVAVIAASGWVEISDLRLAPVVLPAVTF